jgi:hypothetical protein
LPPGYLRICGDYADGGKTLKPARHRQAMLRLAANKFAQSRHLPIYKVDFANGSWFNHMPQTAARYPFRRSNSSSGAAFAVGLRGRRRSRR